jgi:uncharacterized protein
MQIRLEGRDAHVILGYAPGEVRLAARVVTSSALISAESIEDWPVRSVAEFDVPALEAILARKPELIILATSPQQFPAPAVLGRALAARVGLEAMETGAACRTYNVLVSEGRRVLLALIMGAPARASADPPGGPAGGSRSTGSAGR